jgi:hypothetical protein
MVLEVLGESDNDTSNCSGWSVTVQFDNGTFRQTVTATHITHLTPDCPFKPTGLTYLIDSSRRT